jgi:hypothetical protein
MPERNSETVDQFENRMDRFSEGVGHLCLTEGHQPWHKRSNNISKLLQCPIDGNYFFHSHETIYTSLVGDFSR